MKQLGVLAFVVLAFFAACNANAFENRTITLPSGSKADIRIMGPLYSRDNVPSFMLVHVVEGRIKETEALKLAESIWSVLESDIDKREVKNALLLIEEAPKPPASAVYHFQYEKFSDGKWKMTWHH
jgi:hypothetical protein